MADGTPKKIDPRLDVLPEPARSVAFQTVQRLVAEGTSEREAIEQALLEAAEWSDTRAPSAAH